MDFGFGENRLSVHNNIKDAFAAGHQLCLNIKFFEQFFRQTGGSGFIVSYTAIVDLNLHNIVPPDCRFCKPFFATFAYFVVLSLIHRDHLSS